MPAIANQLATITLSMAASFLMAVAVAAYIVLRCVKSGDPLLLLLAIFGALMGWVAAMLVTPFSEAEGQRFGEMATVISGFFTGYLLSKVDPLIGALFAVRNGAQAPIADPKVAEKVLITLISFLMVLLFVLGGRLYWSPNHIAAQAAPSAAVQTKAAAAGGKPASGAAVQPPAKPK